MKPVDQTRFGDPDGNCLAACVASLLDLKLDEVPIPGTEGWLEELAEWLAPRGMWPLLLTRCTRDHLVHLHGYAIVSGPSVRGLMHATVWRCGEMVHDPHPSRAGILDVVDALVLVPFEPSAVRWEARS